MRLCGNFYFNRLKINFTVVTPLTFFWVYLQHSVIKRDTPVMSSPAL